MADDLIMGLNLSHDSSAAILDKGGRIISAVSEERFSRKKNHWGIPVCSMSALIGAIDGNISKVVIGSDLYLSNFHAESLVSSSQGGPSAGYGQILPKLVPGRKGNLSVIHDKYKHVESRIWQIISKGNQDTKPEFSWVRHHNSHIGCALGVQNMKASSLLMSLDGMGDGESGLICSVNSGRTPIILHANSSLDSLGKLYSAVTNRYNFSAERHEGKVTGLAAYGSYSQAVDIIRRHVKVKNGCIEIRYLKGLKNVLATRLFPNLARSFGLKTSINDIVDLASHSVNNYADLAFAVQQILEESVLEILSYWKQKTLHDSLGLAGGVFANVRLNQRIAEEQGWRSVRIFPNMGDGGISVGAVWYEISKDGNLIDSEELFESMCIAPQVFVDSKVQQDGVQVTKVESNKVAKTVAKLLDEGKLVGIHDGPMEFGPRALGARSILIDPRSRITNEKVNKRLRRTEFMPFAPIVRSERAQEIFELSLIQDLHPFKYMTMTATVREEFRRRIPAVVHIDGTARPQIVSKNQTLIYEILYEFELITGIPALINTSFNIHEEPINNTLENSLEALMRGAVDYVLAENSLYYLAKNSDKI